MKRAAMWAMAAAVAAGGTGVARGAVWDTFSVDGLYYKVLSEDGGQGTVELYANDKEMTGTAEIPASVENGGIEYRVTGIGDRAFENSLWLEGVTIPAGVTNIGEAAFSGCYGLTDLAVPDGVASIGDRAFSGCSGLTNLTLGAGAKSIGEKAFWGCGGLTAVAIPEGVERIGAEAFLSCIGLTGARIPVGALDIGEGVFSGCDALASFEVASFWEGKMDWGNGNAAYYPAQLVTFDANGGTCAAGRKGVERGDGKTYGELPEASREWHTFDGWHTAAEGGDPVTADSGVSDENERTLWAHWKDGVSETVDGVKWTFVPDEEGAGVTIVEERGADGHVNMPETLGGLPVTSIGDRVFHSNYMLSYLRIPASVVRLGDEVFPATMTILTVQAPRFLDGEVHYHRVEYYDAQLVTFAANGGMCVPSRKGLEWGKAYGALPEASWAGRTFLGWYTAVEDGEEVTAADEVSEYVWTTLWAHWRDGGEETAGGVAWTYALDAAGTGVVATKAEPAEGALEIPGTLGGLPVTGIGEEAFKGCGALTGATIPDTVASIGKGAFEGTGLTGTRIPVGVVDIGEGVFAGCGALASFEAASFWEGKVDWGNTNAAYYPAQLVAFDANGGTCATARMGVERGEGKTYGALPAAEWKGHPSRGWYTAASGGEPVTADSEVSDENERTLWAQWDGVEWVGDVAWFFTPAEDGTSATVTGAEPAEGALEIPEMLGGLPVTAIGEAAFKGCGALTGVTIPGTVASIGAGAFEGSGLTGARIPVGALDIGEGVFADCGALASFEVPSFWEGKVEWGNSNAAYYAAQLVTFDANGGTCATARMGVEGGEGNTYGTLPAATREGWHFGGWFTEAEGGVKVTAKSGVSEENERTLYAHWELVTGVKARQRWPWNGLVDIDYEILEGMDTMGMEVEITVADASGGTNWTAQTFLAGAEPSAAPGKHRATWDAAADAGEGVVASNLVATVTLVQFLPETLYCVVDLSGTKTNAFLADVPEGGWGDAAKKSLLAMRRVVPGDWNNGAFRMGGAAETSIAKPYYIGVFPVTQKQWYQVMGTNACYFSTDGATRPVEQVTYNAIRGSGAGAGWPADGAVDKASFLGRLRTRTKLSTLDLPTEAQWEFACRAGTETDYNSGKNFTSTNGQDAAMDEVGRYVYNGGRNYNPDCGTDGGTAAVGSYAPNAWGLYDMHGNVWEWCLDWWAASPEGGAEPKGPAEGTLRVLRGGAWCWFAGDCTSSVRRGDVPSGTGWDVGFRLAWTPKAGEVPTTNVASGASAAFRLDTRSGARESAGEETLAFSALWAGGEGATVTIAADGAAFAEGLDGEGEQPWSAAADGTYTLTHATVQGGVTGAVETAQFVVSGKGEAQPAAADEQARYEAWLEKMGGNVVIGASYAARHEDSDGDGISNWMEYLADTNPHDSNAYFQVTATLDEAGNVLLTSDGFRASRRYALLTYTDLNGKPAETDLGAGQAGMVVTNQPEGTVFWRVKARVE